MTTDILTRIKNYGIVSLVTSLILIGCWSGKLQANVNALQKDNIELKLENKELYKIKADKKELKELKTDINKRIDEAADRNFQDHKEIKNSIKDISIKIDSIIEKIK